MLNAHPLIIGSVLAICGFLCRLHYASGFYLNPDEAIHYFIAAQPDSPGAVQQGWLDFYHSTLRVAHPPLFILALREILHFGDSEWLLRLVPVVAGAVFPLFVMLWVRRFACNAAALCAQLLLTFSPTLTDLSAELRGYTLAFLFLSIALLLLEVALERGSKIYMTWFHVFLGLAILTEYAVGWFVAASGLYVLLRLWRDKKPDDIWIEWMAGQAGLLGVYAFLYVEQISKWPQNGVLSDPVHTWLSPAFLQSGQHVLSFVRRGSLNQFRYLLGVGWLAPFAVAVFAFGLYRLLRNHKPLHAMLLLLPLCFACLGGICHIFPFGLTRHTSVLGIAIATGFGIGAAAIARNRMLPMVAAALVLIPAWNWFDGDSGLSMPR